MRFLSLPENRSGRDIVIGDLHGMVHVFEKMLVEVGFNKDVDRVIAVGDLIDRGPLNKQALALLKEPWFFSVKGNHESLMIESLEDRGWKEIWVDNGGGWGLDLVADRLHDYGQQLKALPFAIDFKSGKKLFGIVHADVPRDTSWGELKTILLSDINTNKTEEILTWSRTRINNKTSDPVEGVSMVFCGHTIVRDTFCLANIHYLDTGAFKGQYCLDNDRGSAAKLSAAIIKNGHVHIHQTDSFRFNPDPGV